jgi:hypothetical protein
MIPVPSHVTGKFAPLARMLEGVMLRPSDLAERWGYSDQTLSNHRSAGKGLPFITLPGGSVRYRASEIIAAEYAGTRGPLSVDRVALVLARMQDVPEKIQAAIIAELKREQGAP